MPAAYRIVKARHARAAFSGEGARLAGGRWSLPGDTVVYASASLALAAIETFVHLGESGLHLRFVHFRIEIPEGAAIELETAHRHRAIVDVRDQALEEVAPTDHLVAQETGDPLGLAVPNHRRAPIVERQEERRHLLDHGLEDAPRLLHPRFGLDRLGDVARKDEGTSCDGIVQQVVGD